MVFQWQIYETQFEAEQQHDNPFQDVDVQMVFTAPSGQSQTVAAYWDGGRIWRVRFSPDEIGEWTWRSHCVSDPGLDGQQGRFNCIAYTGNNPVYQRGTLRVSDDQTHLVHADGTPFFWMADTAWNGVLRSQSVDDWTRYLQTRREQGYTVIQYVSTNWRGGTTDLHGETAFTDDEPTRLNPAFFQRLDEKIAAINAHGFIASPIMLWTLTDIDPGQVLSEADCIRLARYIMARYGAYQVVWMLGGDGCYDKLGVDRWQRIGRGVFADRHDRPVTLHPCGQLWIGEDFRGEDWFDFIGYQSGHGDSDEHLRWLVQGPPANDWNNAPLKPVINLEPNYEFHPAYQSGSQFTDREVRRAAYWSLLVSPTAGVTFGHNPIWVWREDTGPAENHKNLMAVAPWYESLETPGTRSAAILKDFFMALPWWELRPAPEMVISEPGDANPEHFIAAAKSEQIAVVYLPVGGEVTLQTEMLPADAPVKWFDPREGSWAVGDALQRPQQTFTAPDGQDWVLCVGV